MNDPIRFQIREDEAAVAGPNALEVSEAAGAAIEAPVGRKWLVRLFEYGVSRNVYETDTPGDLRPLLWTRESAKVILPLIEGARCFADHAKGAVPPSVRNLIGFFSDAKLGAKGPEATLTILEHEEWAQQKMLDAWKIGRPLAFSVRAAIATKPSTHAGRKVQVVTEVGALQSCDLVSQASSGGAALEVLEAQNPGAAGSGAVENKSSVKRSDENNGGMMDKKLKKILEALRAIPNVGQSWLTKADTIETDAAKEGADHAELFTQASEAFTGAAEEAAENGEGVGEVNEQVAELQKQVKEAQQNQKIAESRQQLTTKLAESKLPSHLMKLVREDFNEVFKKGFDVTEAEIDAKIKRVRESYAPYAAGDKSRVSNMPATVGLESRDKAQIAFHKMLGVTHDYKQVHEGQMIRMVKGEALPSDVPGFRGIQEAYIFFTGDREITGRFDREKMRGVAEEFDSASFSNALGSSLTRALLQGYDEQDYGLDLIVPQSSRKAIRDFRQQERIRVGYFGDLDTVDPELGDYPELAKPTDEKATYTVIQKGNLVTITRKTIINDDLGFLQDIVSKLGRAARRTLAQRVMNLMINNAAIYDSVTWAHASSHGANLTSTALSAAQFDAVRTVMRNQTEKDSGKRLGIGPSILIVPHELEGTAKAENMREFLDSNLSPNKARHMFGENGERIVVSPLLTDATDWYTLANQQQVPCIELGFLQGRQEPELLLADQPTQELVFTGDRIRYKVRHEYECVVIDFRGYHKAVVAG